MLQLNCFSQAVGPLLDPVPFSNRDVFIVLTSLKTPVTLTELWLLWALAVHVNYH